MVSGQSDCLLKPHSPFPILPSFVPFRNCCLCVFTYKEALKNVWKNFVGEKWEGMDPEEVENYADALQNAAKKSEGITGT